MCVISSKLTLYHSLLTIFPPRWCVEGTAQGGGVSPFRDDGGDDRRRVCDGIVLRFGKFRVSYFEILDCECVTEWMESGFGKESF